MPVVLPVDCRRALSRAQPLRRSPRNVYRNSPVGSSLARPCLWSQGQSSATSPRSRPATSSRSTALDPSKPALARRLRHRCTVAPLTGARASRPWERGPPRRAGRKLLNRLPGPCRSIPSTRSPRTSRPHTYAPAHTRSYVRRRSPARFAATRRSARRPVRVDLSDLRPSSAPRRLRPPHTYVARRRRRRLRPTAVPPGSQRARRDRPGRTVQPHSSPSSRRLLRATARRCAGRRRRRARTVAASQ
jgi:hypothetical protein